MQIFGFLFLKFEFLRYICLQFFYGFQSVMSRIGHVLFDISLSESFGVTANRAGGGERGRPPPSALFSVLTYYMYPPLCCRHVATLYIFDYVFAETPEVVLVSYMYTAVCGYAAR